MTDAIIEEVKSEKDEAKEKLRGLIENASPERLQSIGLLLEMPDVRAAKYGEVLSLLIDADYDVVKLRVAIGRVQVESELEIIKLRTKTRVFRFLKDEDVLDAGFYYRAFYVKTITTEQKAAIKEATTNRLKFFTDKGAKVGDGSPESSMKAVASMFESEEFADMLANPDDSYRKIVLQNVVEVVVDDEGVVTKPTQPVKGGMVTVKSEESVFPLPNQLQENILNKLEDDLRLLIDEQDMLGKNSQMADML